MTEMAPEYSVHPVLVGQWKKEILEHAGTLFGTQRGPKPVDASSPENKLYGTMGWLKMEVDWLKKAAGFRPQAGADASVHRAERTLGSSESERRAAGSAGADQRADVFARHRDGL